jgi:hypothetical protein
MKLYFYFYHDAITDMFKVILCDNNECYLYAPIYLLFLPVFAHSGVKHTLCCVFIIPSPTKLRRDIVTLPSVLPTFHPSVTFFEHTKINILQWILTKLGTYLVLRRVRSPIDFQGHRSKVNVTGSNFCRVISL